MKGLLVLLLLSAGCYGELSSPFIGWMRDKAGALRPVHGVAGAFVLGEAIAEGVLNAAFMGRTGAAKTETELLVFTAEGEIQRRETAPAGEAIFGFSDAGDLNWVRFADGDCRSLREGAPPCETQVAHTPVLQENLQNEPDAVEPLGADWFTVHTRTALYAMRTHGEQQEWFRLPEVKR